MINKMWLFYLLMALPMSKAAAPGIFFWKPQLGIDMNLPSVGSDGTRHHPATKQAVRDGQVVLLEGYGAGTTVVAIASGLGLGGRNPYFNPISPYFYTLAYKWMMRYIAMMPKWMSGSNGHFCETHRLWKNRFYFMDENIPKWMRTIFLPFVTKKQWEKERLDWQRFKKYAEPAFGKHYRFPTKVFRNYKSFETAESVGFGDTISEPDPQIP